MKERKEKNRGCRVERQFCFKLGEKRTFKNDGGGKLVEVTGKRVIEGCREVQ